VGGTRDARGAHHGMASAPHPQAQARDLFARQEEDLTAFCEGVVELQTGAGIELDVAACGNGGWVPKGTSEGERG
jgi:hypothetical protein